MKIIKINSLFDAISYYNEIIALSEEKLILDFSDAEFIRNNYLSIIGLAVELKKNKKDIEIINANDPKVHSELKNIGFLSQFSNSINDIDFDSSMIKYTNIALNDWDSLTEYYTYFEKHLNEKVNNLSPELSNKIIQKIFELFSNVFRHSKSELGLFCSGQFYSSDNNLSQNKFYFTIVDSGVTIKTNVNKYLKKLVKKNKGFKNIFKGFKGLDGVQAIEWALEDANSTTGQGGLGLSLLKELIQKSNGRLEIISNDGYYIIQNGEIKGEVLDKGFNGTIISIGLSTDDNKYYYLGNGEENGN